MQSLQAKIQNADQQLASIREQLRRAPPAQQAIIKQQAAGILRNRAMWMKQAQTTSAKVANLDQSEWDCVCAARAPHARWAFCSPFQPFPSLPPFSPFGPQCPLPVRTPWMPACR
jgi:hypothetical protein